MGISDQKSTAEPAKNSAPQAAAKRPNERKFLLVAGVWLTAFAALWPTALALAGLWQHEAFQHGYLIPLISLYFLWQRRERVSQLNITPDFRGLPILTGALAIWLVARLATVEVIEHISLLLVTLSLVWVLLGWRVFAATALPNGFLIFAIPIGMELIPLLMDVSAGVATEILRILGYSIYRDGFLLYLPQGTFEVAEACSGFNFLFSGIAMSVAIICTSSRSSPTRVIFVVLSALVFVALNWLRIVIVIAMIIWSDMTMFLGSDHEFIGWIIFAVVLGLQLFVAGRISDREALRTPGT